MSQYISDEKVAEIRNASDIVEVISEHVMLEKAGKDYQGLCPFHSEKTPSFTVSADKQMFYCFGCQVGGNVFHFLMKYDNMSFPEAARLLAEQYGVPLPSARMSPQKKARLTERERLLGLNRQAMAFYHQMLTRQSHGKTPMAYLQERGLNRDIIDAFKLGYAPRSWDALLKHLSAKGHVPSEISKAGLVIPNKHKTGFYDRFRERIVFPIFNARQQVIGFGGRVMDDSLPKYLNSPETPVFNKRRTLYGLPQAKRACRQGGGLYLVEGYFDLLALYRHGIESVCATLGTALTEEHLSLIRGLAREVVLIFDSDEAGIKAALRSVGMFIEKGIDARVLSLPSGHDPDSYINEFGKAAFMDVAASAVEMMPFLMTIASRKHGTSISGKMHIVSDLSRPLASINDPVARQLYVRELAERVGVDEAAVLAKIRNAVSDKAKRRDRRHRRSSPSGHEATTAPVDGDMHRSEYRLERQLLEMMVQFPQSHSHVKQLNLMERFTHQGLRSLGHSIMDLFDTLDGDRAEMMSKVDDPQLRNILASFAIKKNNWTREGCFRVISRFMERRPSEEEIDLGRKIRVAEEHNDHALLQKLLARRQAQVASKRQQLAIRKAG